MNFNIESLKLSLEEAIEVNKAREIAKPHARKEIKRLEKELKQAKRAYNHLLIDIRESKKRQKRLKGYISSYPRNLKLWTEKNFGRLMDKIEFENHFCKGEDVFKPICAECGRKE